MEPTYTHKATFKQEDDPKVLKGHPLVLEVE